MSAPAYDAVVLAGGGARRLGGRDKVAELVGGRTLLDRVLVAVPDAARTVVVGPARPTAVPVLWTREAPPGGGPVAALAAGLMQVTAARVVLLAGDLPFVTADVVRQLLAAVDGSGALLLDDAGREQPLVSAWCTDVLRTALKELPSPAGASLQRLIQGRTVSRLPATAGTGASPWLDCDTEHDLLRARELA
jgi:molybdopterin-guanine dinucleotide biosynthesis protein A